MGWLRTLVNVIHVKIEARTKFLTGKVHEARAVPLFNKSYHCLRDKKRSLSPSSLVLSLSLSIPALHLFSLNASPLSHESFEPVCVATVYRVVHTSVQKLPVVRCIVHSRARPGKGLQEGNRALLT